MGVSRSITEAIGHASWIRRMFEEGLRLKAERGEENVFDFSLGNPDLEPPPALIAALRRVVDENRPRLARLHAERRIPGGARRDRASLPARRPASPYTADHIIMTVGAAGALNATLKALLDPGDEVLLLAPFFAEYQFYVTNHGGRVVVVETDEACQPVVERIVEAITPRTRALIVNSPNNPSGVVYPASFFAELEERLAALGQPLTVLSDEPYRALAFRGVDVPQVPRHLTRAVVCDSWSKALAIPGERIGCIAISPRMDDAAELFARRRVHEPHPGLRQRAGDLAVDDRRGRRPARRRLAVRAALRARPRRARRDGLPGGEAAGRLLRVPEDAHPGRARLHRDPEGRGDPGRARPWLRPARATCGCPSRSRTRRSSARCRGSSARCARRGPFPAPRRERAPRLALTASH